jgi:protein-S-isoprenylcysteine O-methyltransferase Ste14
MKLRLGTPKYARTSSALFALGLGLVFVSRYIGTTIQKWLMAVGLLIVAIGMAALVAGIRAERRDWEATQKRDT